MAERSCPAGRASTGAATHDGLRTAVQLTRERPVVAVGHRVGREDAPGVHQLRHDQGRAEGFMEADAVDLSAPARVPVAMAVERPSVLIR